MDEESLKLLYESLAPGLRAYIRRLTQDGMLADDLLQESFVRLLNAETNGIDKSKKKTYLYTTATRLVYDHWRHLKIRRKWFEEAEENESVVNETHGLPYDMEIVFKQLSPQQRSLLWLAYVEEYDHREIAQMLGLREKSVRVLLYRAKKKILVVLKSFGLAQEALP